MVARSANHNIRKIPSAPLSIMARALQTLPSDPRNDNLI
jgi:hypothetical protein